MEVTHLVHSACQGDLEAFNCLVLACQDQVFHYAIWMLNDPKAAEDVTQETFLLAYRGLHSFRGGDFRCWLLRIIDHLCLEELRRRKQSHAYPRGVRNNNGEEVYAASWINGLAGSPVGDAAHNDPAKTVQAGLTGLSPDLRAVLILVDLQGMDYLQTAKILGISKGSVKRRLARARVRLGAMLFAPSGP